MTFEEAIEGINQLIESLADDAINSSSTYEEAIKKMNEYRFNAYEDVSQSVINKSIRIVNYRALLNPVDKHES